jgi:hypothetical protein
VSALNWELVLLVVAGFGRGYRQNIGKNSHGGFTVGKVD